MARHVRKRSVLRPALTALAVIVLLLSGASAVTWALDGPQPVTEARTLLHALDASSPSATTSAAAPEPAATPLVRRPHLKVRPKLTPPPLPADDLLAGLLDEQVPWAGSKKFDTVPGRQAAPGRGPVRTVRVQIERGLHVDAQKFATFVLATLNDPHSWGAGGRMTFARTDAAGFDVRVLLASPETSAQLCLPLRTWGKLSCRQGNTAVLTLYRWVRTIPDYGADRTGYRHYLVNHEVGHWLGHGHVGCPGRGRRAPVMMQQTKGLRGCAPNPWPYP